MSRELVEQYANGAEKLTMAIRGLTAEDLTCRPAADAGVGQWSIHEVVIHLADAEQVVADRMKRVIAEENPVLLAFDENKWIANLQYDKQSTHDGAEIVKLVRWQMSAVLSALPGKAFERSGMHSEAGKKTLSDLIKGAIHHLEHHLKFIHAKRAKMGKEMW